jgi:hypothetical protein
MALWKDRGNSQLRVAKSHDYGFAAHGGQRPVEKAASVAKAVALRIKADQGSEDGGRDDVRAGSGVRDLP